MPLNDDIAALERELTTRIEAADSEADLEALRVEALGKKGVVSEKMKTLGSMSAEQRKTAGPALNGLKTRIANAITARRDLLARAALEARLEQERLDVSLPVPLQGGGRIHPVTRTFAEIADIFAAMGFEVREGPDIEDDFHNFTALNFPPEHPARELHDTFFFHPKADGESMVLRTHTS
ncbi:MAG: phenylalanine--tRNA ligase subunit alpha, partial [Pseudomonadota bacterium]